MNETSIASRLGDGVGPFAPGRAECAGPGARGVPVEICVCGEHVSAATSGTAALQQCLASSACIFPAASGYR